MELSQIIIIWFAGVLVARMQLRYWFRNRILSLEDFTALSTLSWAIYLVFFLEWIINRLNNK